MTEKIVSKEKPANNELLNRLFAWEIFPWDNKNSLNISTVGQLLLATEEKVAEKRVTEILSNLGILGKDILSRVTPRVESWQATKLLDHIRLWWKAPQKKFWQPQPRA